MKATFMVTSLAVIAHVLAVSKDKEKFYENIKSIIQNNYDENITKILQNPANLKFSWIRFEKKEEDYPFFSDLAALSANNSYSTTSKEIVMTYDSVFVTHSLLQGYKDISGGNGIQTDISLLDKISKEALIGLSSDLFEETKFIELYSGDSGPQMFMLAGNFTSDTWSLLEKIGSVARRGYGFQGTDATEKIPGICLMFELSMSVVSSISANASKLPAHISADLNTLPKLENQE